MLDTSDIVAAGNMALKAGDTFTDEELASLRMVLKEAASLFCERMATGSVGPFCGIVAGLIDVGYPYSWFRRVFLSGLIRGLWRFFLSKRPGGNDFLISRWALSRIPADRDELLRRALIPGPIGETCCWALNSLSCQFREFFDAFASDLQDDERIGQQLLRLERKVQERLKAGPSNMN